MALFSGPQAALAKGQTVFATRLVDFAFTAGTMRLWLDGMGNLVVGSDTYTGTGEIVSLSDVGVSENDTAARATFTVSGVDADFIALAKASEDVRGVAATLWLLFLDEDLQPSGSKIFLAKRYLDVPTYSGIGPSQRGMTIPAETLWTARNNAPHAYFSDIDQRLRFAGDKGLERITQMTGSKRVKWPTT